MTDMERLKLLTDEQDAPTQTAPAGCAGAPPATRLYSDEQLAALLELYGGDVQATAYDVLIRKAENSAVRLPGGAELPDQRAYWLARARSVRPNATRAARRADGT